MSPLSGVLGESWGYYKRFAAHFLAIAFVIYLITAIIVGLLALAGPVGVALGGIADFVGYCLVVAALVKAVQDVRDGRVDLNLGETVRAVLPFLVAVTAASILASIGISIGFVLIIIPGLILLTFWSLIVPSIVLGGEGIFGSFGKSWRTVRGYAWRVFGIYLLVLLVWVAFRFVLAVILFPLPVLPRDFIASIVSGTLVTPFVALVVTLIYYRLTAVHEARAGGAGEPAWPPSGPDSAYRGPDPAYPGGTQPTGPDTTYPGSGSTWPGSGSTSPGPDATHPGSGTQPTGPDGTYPPPDGPPAGPGPAGAGPGAPPA
jgi:hypothetical protein